MTGSVKQPSRLEGKDLARFIFGASPNIDSLLRYLLLINFSCRGFHSFGKSDWEKIFYAALIATQLGETSS